MIYHLNAKAIKVPTEFSGKPDKLVPKLHRRKGKGVPNEVPQRGTCLNAFYKAAEMLVFGTGSGVNSKPTEQRACETKPTRV